MKVNAPKLKPVPRKKIPKPIIKKTESKMDRLKAGEDFYVSLGSGSRGTEIGMTSNINRIKSEVAAFAASLGDGEHVIHVYLGRNIMDSDPEMFPFHVSIKIYEGKK